MLLSPRAAQKMEDVVRDMLFTRVPHHIFHNERYRYESASAAEIRHSQAGNETNLLCQDVL